MVNSKPYTKFVILFIFVFLNVNLVSAVVNWNNFAVFSGGTSSYASNGPGCKGGQMGGANQQMMPGQGCPSNDPAYDLGAVWVDLDTNYIAWQIQAPNLTGVGFCGGPKNSSNVGIATGWAVTVEFDVDSNVNTGCRTPNMTCFQNPPNGNFSLCNSGDMCFPGSEYRFYVYGDNSTQFQMYNSSLATCANITMTENQRTCFQTMPPAMDQKYNISWQINCGLYPSVLKIAVNRSAIINLTGMSFQTNTLGGGQMGPVDILGGFSSTSGGFQNNVMMGGPQDMMSMGQHPCMNMTAQVNCNSSSVLSSQFYSCRWDTFMNRCGPNFMDMGGSGMNCTTFCGACNSTSNCTSGAKGKCMVVNAPPMVPPNARTWVDVNTKMCVEDMSKFMFGGSSGGGSCDSDCKYCYSNSTCSNSAYPSPSGSGVGCTWVTDSYFGKAWCELSTFNQTRMFGCSATNLNRCFNISDCNFVTGNWSTLLNLCVQNGTFEICFDGVDNDADNNIDCLDSDCSKESFCGGDINVLTGGFGTLDPMLAMQKQMFGDMDPSPPAMLFNDPAEGLPQIIDITAFMVKDMGKSLGMGIGVAQMFNESTASVISNVSILCNGLGVSKYAYFVDSDANSSSGCNITINANNYSGFEYRFEYEVTNNGSNSAQEIRRGFRCIGNNTFGLYPAKLAGAPQMSMLGNQKMSCMMDVAILAVDKADLGNSKGNIRFMIATSDNKTSYPNFNDSILGPNNAGVYYTPGAIDFRPGDCSDNPMACGTAFSVIGGGKFMPFEDCFPSSGDEDLDGYTNCNDSDCMMAPWCSGTDYTTGDKTAPSVVTSNTEEFNDFAFMHFITNEPTNATINFYFSCLNSTVRYKFHDLGGPGTFDDFRPWHDLSIRNGSIDANSIAINLTAGQIYYYGMTICDRASNCAVSACLNFTTNSTARQVQYKFDFNSSQNQNPLVNTTSFKLWNGTGYENIDASSTMNKSNYLNDARLLFNNTLYNWSIELEGIDIAKAVNFNMSSAFNVSQNLTSGNTYVGMGNQNWLEMVQSLGADNITITIPGSGSRLMKCNENNVSDCSDVSSQGTLISSGGGYSEWTIPTSLGFSTYTLSSSGEVFNLTFLNRTASSISANIRANASFMINITNNDNVTRMYNLSVVMNTSSYTATINSSSLLTVSLGNVTDGVNRTLSLSVNISTNVGGTYSFYVLAVLANDTTVRLNSTEDVNLSVTFTDNIGPVVALMIPLNNSYSNGTFFCNITDETRVSNLTLYMFNSTNDTYVFSSTTSLTGTYNYTYWYFSSLTPGNYSWTCLGKDSSNNGNYSSLGNFTVAYDNVNPSLNITYPVNNANFSSNLFQVNFSSIDNNLNMTNTSVRNSSLGIVNSTTNTTNGSVSVYFTVPDGIYTILINANDYAGNTNSTSINITVDSGSPNATLNTPQNTTTTSVSSINLTVNLTDAAGIQNATLYVYNQTGLYNSTTATYSVGTTSAVLGTVINFINGIYEWFYKVFDWKSHSVDSQNRTYYYDASVPGVVLNTPQANANLSSRIITINTTISENLRINFTNISINYQGSIVNSTINYSTGELIIRLTVTSDGVNSIYITSYDNATNVNSTTTINMTVDTTIPSAIAIVYPANASYAVNVSSLNYTVSELTGRCWYTRDSGATNSTPAVAGLNFTNVTSTEGSNTWRIYCNDSAGNENSTSVTFFKDTIYPLIEYGTGTENSNTNFSRNWIYVNVSVTETNIANITFTLFNSTGVYNTTIFTASNRTINWTGLINGTFYYNVSIYDTISQYNFTSTRVITLDSGTPIATAVTPANNSYSQSFSQNLTASLTDNLGIKNATLKVYNSTGSYYNSTTNYTVGTTSSLLGTVVNLVQGVYYWFYNLFDFAENTAYSANQTLTIDNSTPALTISYPTNNLNLSATLVQINITTYDQYSGLNYTNITIYYPNLTAVNWTNSSTVNASVNLSVPADGYYGVYATMFDNAVNYNTTSRNITIDSTAPGMTVLSPVNNSVYFVNQSILVHYATNDLTPRDYWHTNISNTSVIDAIASTGVLIINYSSIGIKNITLYVNDSFGRTNSTIVFLNITQINATTTFIVNDTSYNVTANITTVILPYNSTLTNITITSAIPSTQTIKIDLTQLLSSSNTSVSLVNNFTLIRRGTYDYSVFIPANTNLTAGSGWDGKIDLPIINTTVFTAPSSGTTEIVIDVGSGNEINFTKPVKVRIGNMAGKSAAWSRGSATLTNISTACNSGNTTNSTAPTNIDATTTRECYINDGNDLSIWSYHFTSFAAYTPAATVTTTTTTTSGGGSAAEVYWGYIETVLDSKMAEGFTRELAKRHKLNFKIDKKIHSLGVISISPTTVTINVSSAPQQAVLSVGEEKRFELTGDYYNDLYVKLNYIKNNKANFTIKVIHEQVVTSTPQQNATTPAATNATQQVSPADTQAKASEIKTSKRWLWTFVILILIFVIAIILVLIINKKKKRSREKRYMMQFYP